MRLQGTRSVNEDNQKIYNDDTDAEGASCMYEDYLCIEKLAWVVRLLGN